MPGTSPANGGTELSGLGGRQLTRLRRDRVGFVFQAYNLLPVLTAAENITLPLDIAGRPCSASAWTCPTPTAPLPRRTSPPGCPR